MSPFDFINAILQSKKQLIVDQATKKEYKPFLVNKGLSFHMDCIMQANEMNRRSHLDEDMQNVYLINTIRSRKRPFAKWIKAEKNDDLECVKKYYSLSSQKAREALSLLSDEDIKKLKEQTDIGGLRK